MRSRIQKWGNSLAVRIPKPFAEEVGLIEDADVVISLRDGELVVAPSRGSHYVLADLLKKVSPRNVHAEVDTGRRVGREVW